MRNLRRAVAGLLCLLILAGCARAGGATDAAPGPAQEAAVAGPGTDGAPGAGGAAIPPGAQGPGLQLSPASGPPGTEVTVTLRLEEAPATPAGQRQAYVCFGGCGARGLSREIILTASPEEPEVLTGTFTVPLYLRADDGGTGLAEPLAAGDLPIHLACASGSSFGCATRPEVSGTFRVEGGTPDRAWTELSPAVPRAIPGLGALGDRSESPVDGSQRSVTCTTGNLDPRYGEPPPRLLITGDRGQAEEPIVFAGEIPLLGRHGYAGCGALALDPAHPGSFYVQERRHAGGSDRHLYPIPYLTRDRGQTWSPVPAPEGFDPGRTFVGFAGQPDGVIAWFSQIPLEAGAFPTGQVQGMVTRDGGQSWVPVSPSTSSPWQVQEAPPGMRRGLLLPEADRSGWRWAAFGGAPFGADGFYALEGSDGKVLEAVGVSPATDWAWIPMLRSEDGGVTWTWVDVPRPPGGWTPAEPTGDLPELSLAVDGSLLLRQPAGEGESRWYRLERGSGTWVSQ